MSERYQQLRNLVEGAGLDFDKFYSRGNKAAGVRIRKSMQQLKNLAQEIRNDIQKIKNG